MGVVSGIPAASSGGTSAQDKAAFTVGTSVGTPIMGVVNPSDTPPNGDLAIAAVDSSRRLQVAGSFSSTPPTSSTASAQAQTAQGTTAATILAANAAAKGRRIVNTGTTVIKLGLGADPTQAAYHVALSACGTANDGAGGVWDGTMSGCLYTGAVHAISSASGGTCVITELT